MALSDYREFATTGPEGTPRVPVWEEDGYRVELYKAWVYVRAAATPDAHPITVREGRFTVGGTQFMVSPYESGVLVAAVRGRELTLAASYHTQGGAYGVEMGYEDELYGPFQDRVHAAYAGLPRLPRPGP